MLGTTVMVIQLKSVVEVIRYPLVVHVGLDL